MLFTSMQLSCRSRILACCWAALIVPGCSRCALTTEQSAALISAEARWKRSAMHDYSFEFHLVSGMVMPATYQNAARIEVRGDVVKAVTRLGQFDPVGTTIDELFGRIRQASASDQYTRIKATYDSKLGYPTEVVFIAPKGVFEGNSIIEIKSFEELTRQ
jgi:Family of unknown function (DUF6174)